MRVAFLSPCWPHDRIANGIATYVSSVRGGLESQGVEAYVLTPEMSDDEPDPRVVRVSENEGDRSLGERVVTAAAGMVSRNLRIQQVLGYRMSSVLRDIDRRAPLDLFELEETFGIGAVVQRRFRKPVVVRLHGPHCVIGPMVGHPRDREFRLRCWAEYRAIRGAAAVSSPARDALDRVRRFYGLSLPNARVIPNPAPTVAAEEAWRQASCDPKRILFVGRFDRVKGADTLLSGFSRLAAASPDLRLVFVGPDVGLMEGERTLSFEDYLRENVPASVQPQIDFKGSLSNQEVAEERRRAAITVVSSRYETFPMTVLEAMAVGSPLVASRTGGINEMISDGRNGLSFDPEDAGQLASQVERLLADRELAARLGATARADAQERFGVSTVVAQTRDFYEEVIQARR